MRGRGVHGTASCGDGPTGFQRESDTAARVPATRPTTTEGRPRRDRAFVWSGTPDRIRTGATAVRGRRARPLHNGGMYCCDPREAMRNSSRQLRSLPKSAALRDRDLAGILGLEPRITGPEPVVLPITPYPTGSTRFSALPSVVVRSREETLHATARSLQNGPAARSRSTAPSGGPTSSSQAEVDERLGEGHRARSTSVPPVGFSVDWPCRRTRAPGRTPASC